MRINTNEPLLKAPHHCQSDSYYEHEIITSKDEKDKQQQETPFSDGKTAIPIKIFFPFCHE